MNIANPTKDMWCMARPTEKAFIRIGGDEAAVFLQSILTANIDLLSPGHCMPGALLTPQGRVLFDMILYRLEDCFVLESDAPRIDDLFTRLRRYRLRRPITLDIVTDYSSWVILATPGNALNSQNTAPTIPSGMPLFVDPRNQLMGQENLGFRYLAESPNPPEIGANLADINDWHYRRIAAGIPDGPIDLTPERALMLEAGLDQLGAVDFAKGCYIGQEVTARTHYRGLVKRRLIPLAISADAPPPATDVHYGEQIIATTKTSAQRGDASIALALVKLSDIHAILENPAGLSVNGFPASLAIPNWMMPLPNPAHTDKKG